MRFRHAFLPVLVCGYQLAAQVPDFTPPTPLFGAILRDNAAETKRLLDSGSNPNENRFLGESPLTVAVMQRNLASVQNLLAKGALPNDVDGAGSTPLMWAATDETGNPAIVKALLSAGAEVNTKNKMGETALTWAMRRGYTPIVETLRQRGASDREMIRQSVEKAVALLQKSGPEFVKVSGCTSCHNQSLPQMANQSAREHGFRVDSEISEKQVKAVIAMFKPYREQMLQGMSGFPDPPISVSYSLLGLAAEGYAPDATTEAMAYLVSKQQTSDGSFQVFAVRPPLESSKITGTALSLRALQLYGKEPAESVAQAREWLQTAVAYTNEERAMRLSGLAWAGAKNKEMAPAAQELLSKQRLDGGWAQLDTLESDAYATGQAMVALVSSGWVTPSDAVYQKGVAFLLRTQRADGSWYVRSRAFPFQPYKESGFPHGKDQWISAAGTSWAAMALSSAAPKATMPVSQEVSSLNGR